jgi:hypothetical protein
MSEIRQSGTVDRRLLGLLSASVTIAFMAAAPAGASAQVLSGSYSGDGTDSRAITELGFQPDVVIVKGDNTQIGVIRTSSMTGDAAKPMTGATGLTANLIESLNTSGFTVGSDARVNSGGVVYYWIAFKSGSKRLEVGTYAGNGSNPRTISGLGFSPDFLIVLSAGADETVWRSTADTESFNFGTSAGSTAWITGLGAADFTVTNDSRVNSNGATYYYVAWNEVAGVMDVGSYTGDGIDNRSITGVGFQPEYVLIKQDGTNEAVHHPASVGATVDDTLFFLGLASIADRIQQLTPDGFQVGTALDVNESGIGYRYVAWRRVAKQTEVLSGTYTGNGTDNRSITGLGFSPDLVIIKGDTTQNVVLRSYSLIGDLSKDLIDGTMAANRIQSLDAEGFTIGTDARVNSNGVDYHWIAWAAGAGEMTSGTYTGTGTAGRNITDLGFSPDFVIVAGTSQEAVYRNSAASASFSFDATRNTAWISAMGTDGFTVGSDARVNASGQVYGFVAWNEIPGKMVVGTYTGDGVDDRSIGSVGFQPEWALVQRDANGFNALHHPASLGASTDETLFFDNRGAFANYIQALEAAGFQVGTQSNINENGGTYIYAAWKRSALTAVRMSSTSAARTSKGVTLRWRTGYEVDNLGFDVYREANGERIRLTTKPIAGSALFVPPGVPMTAGRSYSWTDESPPGTDAAYWIEDIDLSGKRTLHGTIVPAAAPDASKGSSHVTQARDRDPGAAQSTVPEAAGPTQVETVPPNSPLLEELTRVGPDPEDFPVAVPPPGESQPVPPGMPVIAAGGLVYLGAAVTPSPVTPAPVAAATQSVRSTARSSAASTTASNVSARPAAAPIVSRTSGAMPHATTATQDQPARTTTQALASTFATTPTVPQQVTTRVTFPSGAPRGPAAVEVQRQWQIASQPGARAAIRARGWYRIAQPALVAAGIDPGIDPRNLSLVVDGVERPLRFDGNEADGTFDAGDAIEFYGSGVDTPFTDRQAYWIVAGASPGLRVTPVDAAGPGSPAGASFPHTVERKDRVVFFAALQNGEAENFFGPLIMDGSATDQELTLPHVAAAASPAFLEVGLRGVTTLPGSNDHQVGVFVNGIEVGELRFDGRSAGAATFVVAHALLASGSNTVSFQAGGGPSDMSLVDYVRLTYQREYRADGNQLVVTADPGQELTLTGFTNDAIRVFDVTSGFAARELLGSITADGPGWSIRFTVPDGASMKLFITTADALGTPDAVDGNVPSTLHAAGHAGDVVMITDAAFAAALTPLASLRQSQGYTVQIVDVQDVYDEFAFGQKTPAAIRTFLARAADVWAKPPRFVLLVGNATSDPRDYQGLGEVDFVPTHTLSTDVLETASDDWFVDANDDGFADLAAIGRLPARSALEAATMVDKIVAYEQGSSEAWHNSVLLVSDQGDVDVTEYSDLNAAASGLVPTTYQVTHLKRAEDPSAAQTLRDRLADGAFLLNYQGHGSVDLWRGNLLTATDVPALGNGSRLPLVVAMTCFGGFFHGLFPEESLAEALVRASNGGAIGVWASSGMTDPRWQSSMNRELFRQIFRGSWTSIGEAIRAAKKVVGNADVRRTWIYFGDPALRLKGLSKISNPTTAPATAASSPPEPEESPEDTEPRNRRPPAAAVRLADFDGDSAGDAFIAQPETGAWFAALGEPGSFRYIPGQFRVPGEPIALNLNGDARADVFVYNPESGAWLQGASQGDGTFSTSVGGWAAGLKVVAGDFDGDGFDELLAHHPTGMWFQAFPGGADYSYRRGQGLQMGDLHVADFNGDSRDDAFVYDTTSGNWTLLLSTAGMPTMTSGAWSAGWQAVVANLNGDNAADVMLWHAASGMWVQCIRDPSQAFVYRTGAWTPGGRLHAANMLGDARDELLRYDWRTGSWTLASVDGTGAVTQTDGLWEIGWELTPGDLNGDGVDDLLLYNPDTGEFIRRLNLPAGWTDDASGLWSRDWTVAGHRR